jgi:hypothetical protein
MVPIVPPSTQAASAAVLVAGATATILLGLIRSPHGFASRLPGAAFVLFGGALFWPLPFSLQPWNRTLTIAAACAFLIQFVLDYLRPIEPGEASVGSRLVSAAYLGGALLIAGVLMFHDLGGYAGSLQRWEVPVVGGFPDVGPCPTVLKTTRPHCSAPFGFAHGFETGQSILGYAARRLIWDDGLLSGGSGSLFYGAPTYALFHALGFSPWTLRVSAVTAMLLSIAVIHVLARRFFGPVAGGAAAMMLALNACALFYGRYASSPSGTVLAVLLAVLCTWLFLDRDRPPWWMGALCAEALYVATLQYAPGRLVVLVLLGLIFLALITRWRQRLVGCAVIAVAAVAVWEVQGLAGGRNVFLFGRGEQYFYMTKWPDYVASICPTCAALSARSPMAGQLELLRSWLHITVPQYLSFIRPSVQSVPLRDWDAPIFPNLFYGPLMSFIVWGIGHSLRRWRSWPHGCLLLWVSAVTVALLLTNRIDSHRIMLFVIPLSLWGALGIWEAVQAMTHARVPRALQHLLAAALSLTVVSNDVRLLWSPRIPRPVAGRILADELADVPGPVAVGALIDDGDRGIVELAMLERERRDPNRTGFFIPQPLLAALRQDGATATTPDVVQLEALLGAATVLLAPANQFQAAAALLQQHGVSAQGSGPPGYEVLRLDAASASSSPRDGGSRTVTPGAGTPTTTVTPPP